MPASTGLLADAETVWFKKAIRYTAIAFGSFLVMTLLWPKAKQEELLPEQFAKIVLAKPPKPQAPAAPGSAATPSKSAASQTQQKVEKAAVVQAFRAKALSSAVSGLLKGGMTSLLAQSDFVTGNAATADARKLFDSKSKTLSAGANGPMAAHDVKVGTMGGSASGKNAGYAKGERAAVQGQGKAFVSMDIADAAVDEGLTKDEVGEVIHRHASEIRYCYESAMLRTPDIEGKLTVLFTIGPNGLVKSTAVKASTLPDPRLEDCVLRRLTSWKFPLPKGGVDVPVTYPFVFKTLGR